MPIALRGSAVVPTGNPTTGFSVTIPSGVVAGDWLELPFTSRDHNAITGMPTVTDNDTGGNTWTVTALSLDRKALVARKRATSGTASKSITVAGCVGSTSGVLKCWSGTDTAASPVTDEVVETNLATDETHAGFTPATADSMICAAIFNTGNDNAVTSLAFATLGSTTMTEKLSTGGGDCATAFGHNLQGGGPTATGSLTWAQTDGATYSATWALKPLAPEAHSGSAVLSAGGGITTPASTQRRAALMLTSGGGITPTVTTARSAAPSLTSGGVMAIGIATNRTATAPLDAGGGITALASTQRNVGAALDAGGIITLVGGPDAEEHSGTATLTAGGGIALVVSTQRARSVSLTSGGSVVLAIATARSLTLILDGGGSVQLSGATARRAIAALDAGGLVTLSGATARSVVATLQAGGGIEVSGGIITPPPTTLPPEIELAGEVRVWISAPTQNAAHPAQTGFGLPYIE